MRDVSNVRVVCVIIPRLCPYAARARTASRGRRQRGTLEGPRCALGRKEQTTAHAACAEVKKEGKGVGM